MQIPIIAGIYRAGNQLQPAYPVNLIPTPKASGISNGFLRPAEGLVQTATGQGSDRAAIVWDGGQYRVSGSSLISGDGTVLGDVGGGIAATMDYGFDRMVIVSNGKAYYWDGATLAQITDPDLGIVIDGCWIDGYFLFTDGTSLIVTELNDPFTVNPLKYGSAESDPDPVVAVKRIRTELYAINRFSIEAFDNVGGELFPFQRVEGAMVNKGAIGTKAVCVFTDTLAFVGGGKNESLGVYIVKNAQARKVSTPDIDKMLNAVSTGNWSLIQVETRLDESHQFIYVHLPDRSLVFDYAASEALEQPVWHILASTITGFARYLGRNFVWVDGKWHAGNPAGTQVGYLSADVSHHWGSSVRWELSTGVIYNKTAGAMFTRMEMSALVGMVDLAYSPTISTSYSVDGVTWSMPRTVPAGKLGSRNHRLVWLQQGFMKNWRIQRFQGDSSAHITMVALEAQIEPLAW
jgi:hypothetical protein